ncbi:unnamed protein product [Phytophthora lilii]|uniref:Unnamed protein product n=1 Tax=Phytophthora lilii TaxID=2077276 RepID=A0A9W6UBW4_9STRA|nr:unnamed protein product [Phytophthora lilii]
MSVPYNLLSACHVYFFLKFPASTWTALPLTKTPNAGHAVMVSVKSVLRGAAAVACLSCEAKAGAIDISVGGAAALTTQGQYAPLASTQLKVMSFNVRTSLANDKCPSGCWEQRRWRAKQLVEKYEPDLIGTQEGAPDQIEFFTSNMSYASLGECAGECKWNERDSIFYKPERWEQSSVLVAQRLSETCQEGDAVFLTGDLNAIPTTAAVKYLGNEMPLNGSYTPIPMYDSLTAAGASNATWIGSGFGNHTWEPFKFDYILTRDDAETCLQSASVLVDLFDEYSSSDHAVPISEFCLGSQCTNCVGNNRSKQGVQLHLGLSVGL